MYCFDLGSRNGGVVRTLASHQCGQVWILDLASYVGWVCCWFSSLLRGFFSGFPPQKPTFLNSSSIWKQWIEESLCGFPLKFTFYFLFAVPCHTLQMKLADMELKLESARLLTWKAAMLKDAGENFTKVCKNLIFCHIWARLLHVHLWKYCMLQLYRFAKMLSRNNDWTILKESLFFSRRL